MEGKHWLIMGLVSPLLSGCQTEQRSLDEAGCAIPKEYVRILRRKADPYDHWHVRVDKAGLISWNGQSISLAELRVYTEQLSSKPVGAGRLSLETENGAPCSTIKAVRTVIATSKLCEKKRCVEDKWNADVPLVN